MKRLMILFMILPQLCFAQLQVFNHNAKGDEYFPVVSKKSAATIFYDVDDHKVVETSAQLLSLDISRVTKKKAIVVSSQEDLKGNVIIVGSIGNNRVIDQLIKDRKLNVDSIVGGWERYVIQVIEKPMRGVKKALVIAGSDKRGAAYGIFSLSEAIGVSPWYYWADVPIRKSQELYVGTQPYISKTPSVKFRGIFLNDEDWGLHPWAAKNIDKELADIGPKTYEKVFELLLRLKGNILAPAMHECTKAFFTVPGNMEMANNYGIMITTSHCEPLLYNNASEWDKEKQGEWNYVSNKDEIIKVLEERVSQAHKNENIYTIALRGMHDEGMKGGSDEEKLQTLDEAIKDQRALLEKYIEKPLQEIPQIFVPYKEVLGLYEKGLEVPEDITIVWPDDNYGYIKKLSNREEQQRDGGSGVYYHISYLGWPNDYLWLNTTSPALMFAEMQKAYSLGADEYWLLNVGDIKPGELGTQLFLDMAWDFDRFSFENINDYQAEFLSSIFGDKYREELKFILDRYYFHGFTRKPEYMTWDWRWNSLFAKERIRDTDFSFIHYKEAESRLNDYLTISNMADRILSELPEEKKAAFFELVYYPVKGASLYNHEMLIAQKNRWYAKQKRAITNELAEKVKLFHDSLAVLTDKYNNLLDGKWSGMMTAPGFLPEFQLPPVKTLEIPEISEMGVWVEGDDLDASVNQYLKLPEFYSHFEEVSFFEVFSKGSIPVKWKAVPSQKWIKVNPSQGETASQQRVNVSIDWDIVPKGMVNGTIKITDGKSSREIEVKAVKQKYPDNLFVGKNGALSIKPSAFHRKTENEDILFQIIDGLGYANSSLQLGHAKYDSGNDSFVEYDFFAENDGEITIYTYMLPLFPKDSAHDTRYGVQVDDMEPVVHSNSVKEYSKEWAQNVLRNSAINETKFVIDNPGKHTLKIISIDPGMIIQKIVIDFGGLKKTYLGPPVQNLSEKESLK
ncbi:glycosyl hydrolase 115 family protein [Thermophagus sp. OGC60D27]|uniref:glycosyl hydrolase 115 family protein n=1 Tax=Thermophagus sp. OGC60D27 TaxID=3458415 RepID=UPI004038193A